MASHGEAEKSEPGHEVGVGKEVNICTSNSWGACEGHILVTQGPTEAGDQKLDTETTYSMAAL